MFRAERLDGKGKVDGYYVFAYKRMGMRGQQLSEWDCDRHLIVISTGLNWEIDETTLEVFLFGEWRLVSELDKPCEWKLDKDNIEGDSWYTSCNQRDISFCAGDAKENKYKFCPYCGRPIKEI